MSGPSLIAKLTLPPQPILSLLGTNDLDILTLYFLRFILNKFSLSFLERDNFFIAILVYLIKLISIFLPHYHFEAPINFRIFLSDLWGPSPVLSLDKKLYDFSKISFFNGKKHFDTKKLSLYTNCGGEYKILDSHLLLHDIQQLSIPPYTAQRIALAEQQNRNIIETARTLLHGVLPTQIIFFWM